MSKYNPLEQVLLSTGQDHISMTFPELEQILGFALPKSAYTYYQWWENGTHSQSKAWLDAGYKVEWINLKEQIVSFFKGGSISKHQPKPRIKLPRSSPDVYTKPVHINSNEKTLMVCDYKFECLQQLAPECDAHGCIIKYYPQKDYINKKNLPLSIHGGGAFCRFSINAGDWPGVYLWVVDKKIIYIGETEDLKRRFNMGYGQIAPRNCYIGGQSTNCKMNKVLMSLYEQGKMVNLYFYNTTKNKQVEIELLRKIITPHNVKDNKLL